MWLSVGAAPTIHTVGRDDELIQITERQLADAEAAYRVEPSEANQRRIMRAWTAVREARGAGETGDATGPPEGRGE
jgi:hypothetical protein